MRRSIETLGVTMRLPASVVAFLTTWAALLLIFSFQAIYFVATTVEPDAKFGESAPYIGLALFGGIGGFIAAMSSMVATFVFEVWRRSRLKIGSVAKVCGISALPFAFLVWYAAVWSPLAVFGTVTTLFLACMAIFLTLLYVTQRQRSNT